MTGKKEKLRQEVLSRIKSDLKSRGNAGNKAAKLNYSKRQIDIQGGEWLLKVEDARLSTGNQRHVLVLAEFEWGNDKSGWQMAQAWIRVVGLRPSGKRRTHWE